MKRKLMLALLFSLSLYAAGPSSVTITNLAQPGAVEIANSGPGIELSSQGLIERRNEGEWVATYAHFELIAHCGTDKPAACIPLAAGAHFQPVRWDGHNCSGQCARSCRSNAYIGPGEFRVVVYSCDRKQRFAGPPFRLP